MNKTSEFIKNNKFRVFPLHVNKKPKVMDWRNAACFNPDIGTEAYGILCGQRIDGKTLVVIDIDNHTTIGKSINGVNVWKNKKLGFFQTLTIKTPRGGYHLYFWADDNQIKELEEISHSNKLFDECEIFYQTNHYIVGALSKVGIGKYEIIDEKPIQKFPDALIAEYSTTHSFEVSKKQGRTGKGTPVKNSLLTNKESDVLKRELQKKALDGAFDSYEDWLRLGMGLKSSGFEVEDWQELSLDDDKTQQLCLSKWGSFKEREGGISVGTLFWYAPDAIPTGADWFKRASRIVEEQANALFKGYVKLRYMGIVVVFDLMTNVMMSWEQAKRFFTGRNWEVDKPIMKANQCQYIKANAFPIWFENPPYTYIDMITDAEKPSGHNEMNGSYVWNDYQQPEFYDGSGTPDMFLEHLKENVCQGNEEHYGFLMNWIAHLIKYPNSKNGVALFVKGDQGSGKSVIFDVLSYFFDNRFTTTVNKAQELTRRFNSQIASCYLISLEEAVFEGVGTDVLNVIKDLLTNTRITEERKGYEPKDIKNNLHIMATTNKSWGAPKEHTDRRYFVLETNNNRRKDAPYFIEMKRQMQTGGCKKLYDWVMNESGIQEIEDWKIPTTKASETDIFYSASKTAQLWFRLIEDYENNEKFVSAVFETTRKGKIYFKSSNLYEFYKNEGVSVDKARKETKKLFGAFYKSISINGKSTKVFVFDDVAQMKKCLIDNAFSGVDIFDTCDEVEVPISETAETEDNILAKVSA